MRRAGLCTYDERVAAFAGVAAGFGRELSLRDELDISAQRTLLCMLMVVLLGQSHLRDSSLFALRFFDAVRDFLRPTAMRAPVLEMMKEPSFLH